MEATAIAELFDWQSISLFQDVPEKKVSDIIETAQTRKIAADTFLFFEGDPADILYVLISGHIKLSRTTTEGDQVIMRYVAPGEAFGVIAVLSEIQYPVTAQAIKPGQALWWDRKTMTILMNRQPQIALNAIKILANRNREFQERVQELATERMERRIARALARLANQSGKRVEEGVLIDLRITRQDLADLTGTSMFSVSRTLSQWESRGIILCRREEIIIRQPHLLVAIAEDLT